MFNGRKDRMLLSYSLGMDVHVFVDSCTLSDLYYGFSGGQLDGSLPLLDLGATVDSFVGRTKKNLFRVNRQCSVDEVVSSLGQYICPILLN